MTKGEPILRATMLTAARAWAKVHRARLATVSNKAHGDQRFFERMARNRGSFTGRKYDEVMAWLSNPANWKGGAIPAGAIVDPFSQGDAPPAAGPERTSRMPRPPR